MNVSQKKKLRIGILFRNTRLKFLEYVEFGEIGLGLIEVVEILSSPAKSLTGSPFDAASINAAILQHRFMLRSKVFANHSDHSYFGEVTSGKRKVSRSAAKNVVNLARRSSNSIEGNRSYY